MRVHHLVCLFPGTAQTLTGPGVAGSSAGNTTLLGPLLGAVGGVGRRLHQNLAASLNPPSAEGCTEQRVTPNGMGGGAISQVWSMRDWGLDYQHGDQFY